MSSLRHARFNITSFRNQIRQTIKTSLKKNLNISVQITTKTKNENYRKTFEYANYVERMDTIYDDLSFEILYDLEACSFDYPESKIDVVCDSQDDELFVYLPDICC